MTKLITPIKGSIIAISNNLQRKYINEDEHDFNHDMINWAHSERYKEQDDTFPQLNLFQWESDGGEAEIEIAEHMDFTETRKIKVTGSSVYLHNFKAAAVYYWRVNGCEPALFRTEDTAPCFYEVEGISNVRDAGNWTTKYGKRIKQGMLFRGSEMNIHHRITEAGIDVMRNILKIHMDLDLRGEAKQFSNSPLGEDVAYKIVPTSPYAEFLKDKETCKKLFDIFAEEKNYPIYYHCWGGADRTGTIACMLGVALGMCEKDILLDYEITSLSVWGERNRESNLYQAFLTELEQYEGEIFEEKIMNFLYSCSITEEQLEKIRGILLE